MKRSSILLCLFIIGAIGIALLSWSKLVFSTKGAPESVHMKTEGTRIPRSKDLAHQEPKATAHLTQTLESSSLSETELIEQAANEITRLMVNGISSRELAEYLNAYPKSRTKNLVLEEVCRKINSQPIDEQMILRWLEIVACLTDRHERGFASTYFENAGGLSYCSKEVLLSQATASSDPQIQSYLYQALGLNEGRTNREQALKMSAQLPEKMKDRYLTGWHASLEQNIEPAEALKLLNKAMNLGLDSSNTFCYELLDPALKAYGGQVLEELQGHLSLEKSKTSIISRCFERWVQLQPEAASTWLNALSSSRLKNLFIEKMVGHLLELKENDVQGITAWTEAVTDSVMREKLSTKIARELPTSLDKAK